ncbi:MAG: tripeptide aminopeptidase PepT, partial [Erysipelotrichaceae bacterium]|nr:tripeptide aminopeptidase PepT [Erysipelotrichaceae bacterium]
DMYVVFTPDEEIGGGTKCFEYDKCKADFAFTIDGGAVDIYEEETFNAAGAQVNFTGVNIHPGSAKGRMRNASLVAMEFNGMLPVNMRPEFTEGRDGFFHMMHMEGNIEKATLGYIIRNHSSEVFEQQIRLLSKVEEYINAKYGECCKVSVKYSYKNMKEVMKDYPQVKELAFKAMKEIGLTPKEEVIRGGTDGANLSFNGLPCPNLGAGGGNFHGPLEYCVVEEMEKASELIVKILELA